MIFHCKYIIKGTEKLFLRGLCVVVVCFFLGEGSDPPVLLNSSMVMTTCTIALKLHYIVQALKTVKMLLTMAMINLIMMLKVVVVVNTYREIQYKLGIKKHYINGISSHNHLFPLSVCPFADFFHKKQNLKISVSLNLSLTFLIHCTLR